MPPSSMAISFVASLAACLVASSGQAADDPRDDPLMRATLGPDMGAMADALPALQQKRSEMKKKYEEAAARYQQYKDQLKREKEGLQSRVAELREQVGKALGRSQKMEPVYEKKRSQLRLFVEVAENEKNSFEAKLRECESGEFPKKFVPMLGGPVAVQGSETQTLMPGVRYEVPARVQLVAPPRTTMRPKTSHAPRRVKRERGTTTPHPTLPPKPVNGVEHAFCRTELFAKLNETHTAAIRTNQELAGQVHAARAARMRRIRTDAVLKKRLAQEQQEEKQRQEAKQQARQQARERWQRQWQKAKERP